MDDVIALEHHMLNHCSTDVLRNELREHFRRHPFSVVSDLVLDDEPCAGVAWFDSCRIELNRSLLDETSDRALHVYLHEVAHIVTGDVHTLDFAELAAGLQKRFHCRDTSGWRLAMPLAGVNRTSGRTSSRSSLPRSLSLESSLGRGFLRCCPTES